MGLSIDRRRFLGSSAGGLAAALSAGPALLGAETSGAIDATAGPDTLFLTWQRDPTTTVTVQWVGPASDALGGAVRIAPLAASGSAPAAWRSIAVASRPFPLTALTLFRAEATGLTPGVEYRLAVGRDAPPYRFRTMPAKATEAIQFVSGGDCGVNAHVVANNVLAARQDPRFAVIGGDLAYDNGKDPRAVLAFLRNYSKHMVDGAGRLIPMLACIGNHEVSGGYGKTRDKAPLFLALFDGLFADATYAALDFGNYLSLVLLDTGHVSPIGGEQTSWLDKALRDRADRPHLIAVNHVPAYPSFRASQGAAGKVGTGEGNRTHWVPLFEKHGVDVVLEHHDHTFKRTHPLKGGSVDRDGIVYLGDGSWGKLRSPKAPEARPYLASVGQAYHLALHRLEGDRRFHLALEEGGKVADICTTEKKPRHRLPA